MCPLPWPPGLWLEEGPLPQPMLAASKCRRHLAIAPSGETEAQREAGVLVSGSDWTGAKLAWPAMSLSPTQCPDFGVPLPPGMRGRWEEAH